MMKPALIFIMSFWFSGVASAQQTEHLPDGLCPLVVDYSYYSLCYDQHHRQARWVKYKLTLDMVNGNAKRTNDYRADYNIEDPVLESDYRGSGFDRGHLLPAADMKLNHQSMSETFYMTNMSPQNPNFNRSTWASIEGRVRTFVRNHGEAHVVTAGILEPGLPTLKTGVSIPQYFFKVMYFPKDQSMAAFLIENRAYPKGTDHEEFLVSVDEVEQATGFDFFQDLPDPLENSLEARLFHE